MGLNDEFRKVRSNILSMESQPKLDKVYQMVSHEEAQQGLASNPQTNATQVFFAKGSSSKSHVTSSHIGKTIPQSQYQPSTSQTPNTQNLKKRVPPPPIEPIYYKCGRQVNTKYYCFDYSSVFGHSNEKCYAIHGLPIGHKLHMGSSLNTQGTTYNAITNSSLS